MKHKIIVNITAFLRVTVSNYIKNDCSHRASSLTITSLLEMVPLLAVFFGLLTLLPNFDQLLQPLQHFIFDNFLPNSGRSIQAYILKFTSNASHFSLVGGVGLLLSSLLLVYNIELALNKIWHVTKSRTFLNACVVYLSILVLLPMLLGLSLLLSSYVRTLSIFGYEPIVQTSTLLLYAPFFLSWAGFTCLYYIIPNRRVKFGYAQLSALLATILFELMQKGFALYLTYFGSYELIYGVFSTIPIFIIWIYLVWLLTLFCAEFNYSLQTHAARKTLL